MLLLSFFVFLPPVRLLLSAVHLIRSSCLLLSAVWETTVHHSTTPSGFLGHTRVRGPVARDIIDLKKPPVERRTEFYDAFASDVGGWDELLKLDNPRNIARYSRKVNQIIQEAQDVWTRVSNDLFSRMILCFEDEALSTIETLEEGDVPGALRVFRERYGKETEQGRYQMLRRFFNLTMTGSSARKLEEHIAIYKALLSDLKKLNPPEEPSEGQKVAAFLGSLEAACPDRFCLLHKHNQMHISKLTSLAG